VGLHFEQLGWIVVEVSSDAPDDAVAMFLAQGHEQLDVEALLVTDDALECRDRGHPRAAANCFARDSPADLAEAFDGEGASVEGADGPLRGDDDAEPGEEVFYLRFAGHDALVVRIAERSEVGFGRPEV